MSEDSNPQPPPGGQFLVYQTADGKLKIDVRFEGETVWLTQQHMAELFQTTKQNIAKYLQAIFADGELRQESVVNQWLTTESAASSPSAKIAFKCLATFCFVVWNSSAIPAWDSQRDSWRKRHSTRDRPSSV